MTARRRGEKTVLSRQDIRAKRKALNEKRVAIGGAGAKAIIAVLLLALSVLAFFAVATFDARDRLGPGFHNAIGPVGHALAEMLRGFFGVGAFVLPVMVGYLATLMMTEDRSKRRWPQVLCVALLLVCGSVLAQLIFGTERGWAHPPGGLLGKSVGGAMTALFSTVGTVVLVSALASVALMVGTQFYFLKFVHWALAGLKVLLEKTKVWGLAFIAAQKHRLEERALKAEEDARAEEEFLAELDEQDAELQRLELEAEEAEQAAEATARHQRETEETKLQRLAAKEAERQLREQERQQREVERLARQMLKETRAEAKARAMAQAAITEPPMPAEKLAASTSAVASPVLAEPIPGQDPAWAMTLPSPVRAAEVTEPPPPARQPRIANLPEVKAAEVTPPPVPLDASLPPTPAGNLEATVGAPAAAVAPPVSTPLSTALARTPVIVEPKTPPKPSSPPKKQEQFEFVGDRKYFAAPPIDILEMNKKERNQLDKEVFLTTAEKLRAKLADFGIVGEVVEIRPGPVVTMYEFLPGPGIKVSKIAALADDLAMAMEAMRVRIVAPIPGKGVVGIEVPNRDRETVFLKEVAEQDAFQKSSSRLTMCLGKDIEGMPYVFDLAKAPHLLIAGTTGSGKSVAVNSMIMSILLKSTPEEVRFLMVDPKMLELSVYEGIPHLLLPVVTDPRKAAIALQWAVDEMTRRYKMLAECGVRNIAGYNALVASEQQRKSGSNASAAVVEATPTKDVAVGPMVPTPAAGGVELGAEELPNTKKRKRLTIVDVDEKAPAAAEASQAVAAPEMAPELPAPAVVEANVAALESVPQAVLEAEAKVAEKEGEIRVDETAEEAAALAMVAQAAAETKEEAAPAGEEKPERKKLPYIVVIIDELADLMMVASKEVETSVARLAQMARAAGIHLMVATQRPSTDVVTGVIKANFPTRISFMLRSKPDSMTVLGTVGAEALLGMGDMLILPPTSAHLERVHGCFVSEVEIKRAVDHLKAQGKPVYDDSILKPREDEESDGGVEEDMSDELYDQAIAIVSEMRNVSISMLQRKMRIGYNRSARMIERMERDGIVGPADGAKPREVLVRGVGEMPGAGAM